MDDLTNTLPTTVEGANEAPDVPIGPTTTPNKIIKAEVQSCKNFRNKLIKTWDTSVNYRKGEPFSSTSDEDRISVPLDWSYTKMKQASLFSQIPQVRINHSPQTTSKDVMPWLHNFEQRINDTLITAGTEGAMEECLSDCINAAGIGVILASYETLTQMVQIPAIDPSTLPDGGQSGLMPDGSPIPMSSVPKVIDKRYLASRISPSDFLWPLSFGGSDFDTAPWLGRSGKVTWAEAQRRWKLDPAKKNNYVGDTTQNAERINRDSEKDSAISGTINEFVCFDELFYREEKYNPDVTNFSAIHHLVFINGVDEAIVDEPWKGQTIDPQTNQLIGVLRYPIRVLTLTYITDDAIPPSDSAIARPQVNELNKSRTQIMLQRQHSLPLRAFDVNRIDPAIQYNLMRGVWQGMIPVQGNAQNIISEISRSSFPQENFTFDGVIKADAVLAWQVGQDPLGNDIETKGEANVVQSNFQTRIAAERAKVGKFFCSIAEVIGGFISLYEDPASIGQGFMPPISRTLGYSILADSTVLLDTNQRLKKIVEFTNMFAKGGWVNMEELTKEAATLSGLDPSVVVVPPPPKAPAEPNISLRLTGTEDLLSPMAVAMLEHSGQSPTLEEIETAKKKIEAAVMPPAQTAPQLGPDGSVMPSPPPDAPNQPPPPGPGEANPNYSAMPKVNQRTVDRS